MKVSKPIILPFPLLLVEEIDKRIASNPPLFAYKLNNFYFIINYIASIENIYRKKNQEFHPINKTYLRNAVASDVDKYIKYLTDINFLKSNNNPKIIKQKLKYKLTGSYYSGEYIKIEIIPSERLFKKIINNQRKKRNQKKRDLTKNSDDYLFKMYQKYMMLELDYEKAENWILNAVNDDKKKFYYLTSLYSFKDKRFRKFKRNNKNNRLDSNLTNMKKELRSCLKGEWIVIDLKNSQPFLLGVLLYILNDIDNHNTIIPLCQNIIFSKLPLPFGIKRINEISKVRQNQENSKMSNLSMYYEAVKNGRLYDEFINEFDGEITRDEAKDLILKVMFSSNEDKFKTIPFEKQKKKFASVYPFVYDCIKALKHNDNKNNLLPIFLQKLESYLFIDCISKRLVDEGIIPLTVHDSVMVESEHFERTLEIMQEVFLKEVGVIPTFDVKAL